MDLRRYYRNRLKSAITERNDLEAKSRKLTENIELVNKVLLVREEENRIKQISSTINVLVSWLEHDILNKAGSTPNGRRELYDFVVEEFGNLERIEAHRIKSIRTTLENKRDTVLRFSDVLVEKFEKISQRFTVPVESIWAMCKLQRCDSNGDQCSFRFRSRPELPFCNCRAIPNRRTVSTYLEVPLLLGGQTN